MSEQEKNALQEMIEKLYSKIATGMGGHLDTVRTDMTELQAELQLLNDQFANYRRSDMLLKVLLVAAVIVLVAMRAQ